MRITKVGVVGAGVMGHGIAALCASAGLPVVLLDVPGSDDPKSPDRSAPAKNGLTKAIKNKPAAFMDTDRAALIRIGNTADHLELLTDCDWIIEVVVERLDIKQSLFEKVEKFRKPGTLISSNTSGIPIHLMTEGRSDDFKAHFLGTHCGPYPSCYTRFENIFELPSPKNPLALSSRCERSH